MNYSNSDYDIFTNELKKTDRDYENYYGSWDTRKLKPEASERYYDSLDQLSKTDR